MYFRDFIRGLMFGILLGSGIISLSTTKSNRQLRRALKARIDYLLSVGEQAAQKQRAELEAELTELERRGVLNKKAKAVRDGVPDTAGVAGTPE